MRDLFFRKELCDLKWLMIICKYLWLQVTILNTIDYTNNNMVISNSTYLIITKIRLRIAIWFQVFVSILMIFKQLFLNHRWIFNKIKKNLGVIAKKRYSTLPNLPEVEHYHWVQFNLLWWFYGTAILADLFDVEVSLFMISSNYR